MTDGDKWRLFSDVDKVKFAIYCNAVTFDYSQISEQGNTLFLHAATIFIPPWWFPLYTKACWSKSNLPLFCYKTQYTITLIQMQILHVLLKLLAKMNTPLTGSEITQEISNCTAVTISMIQVIRNVMMYFNLANFQL
jgi:hypothetical protein